jgi:hypothetical protein
MEYLIQVTTRPPRLSAATNDIYFRCSLAVGIGVFSFHVLLFGSYANVLVKVSDLSTPPTAYKIPLIKLAVNAPRAVGRFAHSVHLLEVWS